MPAMLDVVARPSFRALHALTRSNKGQGIVQRDTLLQELGRTYLPEVVDQINAVLTGILGVNHAGMVVRLADVIDGCIGLPPGSVPPMSQQSAYSTQPSTTSSTSVHTQVPLQGSPSVVPNSPTLVVIPLASSLVDTTSQPLNSSNNDEDGDASHSGALLETIRYNWRWPRWSDIPAVRPRPLGPLSCWWPLPR